MFLLAVLSYTPPLEAAAGVLASRLGMTLYEARARLVGEAPRVVSVFADGEDAAVAARLLSREGFAGVVADGDDIEMDDRRDQIAKLGLGDEALTVTLRDGRQREVPYSSIVLLLKGTRTSQSVSTREETTRQFSPGKALLTGGLVMRTSSTKSTTTTTRSRQAFLYIYDDTGGPTLALYEQRISYAFLGAKILPSSLANFNTVVADIQRHAPSARYDERLVKSPTLGSPPLPPRGIDPDEWRVDIAATLLAMDARRAQ